MRKPGPGAPTGARAKGPPAQADAVLVAPPEVLAEATIAVAREVEEAVFQHRSRADRALSEALKRRRHLAPPDQRFVSRVVFGLFRWWGWVEPLTRTQPIEARILLSSLLELPAVPAAARVWARAIGREPSALIALGDAPNWPARVTGLRRLVGGRPLNGDPWRLFPDSLKGLLPVPPGEGPTKVRLADFLATLQRRAPLWVRAQGADPEKLWDELRAAGLKPWVHRRILHAARLDPDVDVYHLPAYQRGELEIQDLASQAVGLACDPEPGERWWDACAGAGGKSLQLASIMTGKGVIVATDRHDGRLKEAVRRARKSPFRNVTTKLWDGHHVVGKAGRYDGALVDAPCSGIGTWRRNPDARWLFEAGSVGRLAELQSQLLNTAAGGVKVGGTLVYSVCTPTPAETTQVLRSFLDRRKDFRLDPFAHPLTGDPTDGTVTIWPAAADSDLMFIARMIRTE